MPHDHLVYMANQIGKAFAYQPEDQAVASIAGHLKLFWDPRMRRQILEDLDSGALDPRVRRAVASLRGPG